MFTRICSNNIILPTSNHEINIFIAQSLVYVESNFKYIHSPCSSTTKYILLMYTISI